MSKEEQQYGFRDFLRTSTEILRSEENRELLEVSYKLPIFIGRLGLGSLIHPIAGLRVLSQWGTDTELAQDFETLLRVTQIPQPVDRVVKDLSKELTIANGFSATRPLLVVAANTVGLDNPTEYAALMAAAFGTDALDGWAARKFGPSPLGGAIDIAADRTTEGLMYFYLAGQGVIPNWIPAVTMGRALATDLIRTGHILLDQELSQLQTPLSVGDQRINVLATSRPIRAGYATLKAAVALTAPISPPTSYLLSEVAAGVCLVRGIPVIFNRENQRLIQAIKNAPSKSKS